DAVIDWMLEAHPGIGHHHDVIIPMVGECDDSWLNDAAGRHVTAERVYEALGNARTGAVTRGSVGGGTGMVCCDLNGRVGGRSRRLPSHQDGVALGVLLMWRCGRLADRRFGGAPVGMLLAEQPEFAGARRIANYGRIIAVVATNAPLLSHPRHALC